MIIWIKGTSITGIENSDEREPQEKVINVFNNILINPAFLIYDRKNYSGNFCEILISDIAWSICDITKPI